MSKVYLKDYLQKIIDGYNKVRPDYVRLNEELARCKEQWQEELNRGWSDANQREEAQKKYYDTELELKHKIQEIIDGAKKEFTAIREEADKVFSNHYRIKPEQLDLKGLELLKTGILRTSELIALVDDYAGNRAMQRILNEHITERLAKEPTNKALITARDTTLMATREFTAHAEALDSVIDWSVRGLGDDYSLSERMNSYYDTETNKVIEASADITADDGITGQGVGEDGKE